MAHIRGYSSNRVIPEDLLIGQAVCLVGGDRVKISEWKRSKRAKRVEFFLLLVHLLFGPPTYLYTQCLLSVISAFSFHMSPAVSIVLHFCPFTPYTTTLHLRLYHAHTSFALQHTYTISTLQHTYIISALQLADTLFSTLSLAGALFNTAHSGSDAFRIGAWSRGGREMAIVDWI